MNTETSVSHLAVAEGAAVVDPRSPTWGAIVAGAVAGLGVHFLLLMLSTAIGLGAAQPATDDNPLATFGIGTALAWTISALIALFVGGWVAGRCSARVHSVSGGMHGFLVWCVATIVFLGLVAGGAGALVGGATRIVGQGLSAMGKPVAGAVDVAKQAVDQNAADLTSFVDEVALSDTARNAPGGVVAARRDVGQAVRQLFREGGNLRDPQARAALVRALTQSAGLSEADANARVDAWTASIDRARVQADQLKAAAATKAREAADKTSAALSRAALWAFIGFALGAFAAVFGGRSGAHWEYNHTEIVSDATLDPAHRPRSHTTAPGHA